MATRVSLGFLVPLEPYSLDPWGRGLGVTNWGSVADWASAIGSLSAVTVALGLALRDSRKWHHEAAKNDHIQASMLSSLAFEAWHAAEDADLVIGRFAEPRDAVKMLQAAVATANESVSAMMASGIRDPELLTFAVDLKAGFHLPKIIEFLDADAVKHELSQIRKVYRDQLEKIVKIQDRRMRGFKPDRSAETKSGRTKARSVDQDR